MPLTKATGQHAWLWLWLREFARNVGRRNDYYWPGERCSIRNAGFVAKVVADTCISIRAESRQGTPNRAERAT